MKAVTSHFEAESHCVGQIRNQTAELYDIS